MKIYGNLYWLEMKTGRFNGKVCIWNTCLILILLHTNRENKLLALFLGVKQRIGRRKEEIMQCNYGRMKNWEGEPKK